MPTPVAILHVRAPESDSGIRRLVRAVPPEDARVQEQDLRARQLRNLENFKTKVQIS